MGSGNSFLETNPAKELSQKACLAACIQPTDGLPLPGRETAVHQRRGKIDKVVRRRTKSPDALSVETSRKADAIGSNSVSQLESAKTRPG
jgi:hypothetical protein